MALGLVLGWLGSAWLLQCLHQPQVLEERL